MSLAKNILLFGATGNIGSYILNAILSSRPQFNRIAIFTSPHTASTKSPQLNRLKEQGVEVIVGNVQDENAVKAAYEGE
jgi:FlaA1/EpsC-like NDP-sugar epimerase